MTGPELVAIDFGTTRTKLAYLDGRRPELMRFERDLPYAPSLFHLPAGGEQILWGWEAEAMAPSAHPWTGELATSPRVPLHLPK